MASKQKQIHIQYYALLREQRGTSAETLSTGAQTPRELYADLRTLHKFSLDCDRMTVAVNDEFVPWEKPLQENDRVVFIPPVAGG